MEQRRMPILMVAFIKLSLQELAINYVWLKEEMNLKFNF